MRILLLTLALLALSTFAFAADIVGPLSAGGVVSLTIEKYVAITNVQNSSITMAGNVASAQTPAGTPVQFHFTTNCPSHVVTGIADGAAGKTANAALVWKLRNVGDAAFVAGPLTHTEAVGGFTDHDLDFDVEVSGVTTNVLASTNYGATVTATITAP